MVHNRPAHSTYYQLIICLAVSMCACQEVLESYGTWQLHPPNHVDPQYVPVEKRDRIIANIIAAVGAFQLATDVLVLLLPIRTIWNLTMPVKTRLAILSIFLVGGVSTIAGCLRFYYSYRFWRGTSDPGGVTLAIEIWGFIEICLAMFCGCAPCKCLRSALHNMHFC